MKPYDMDIKTLASIKISSQALRENILFWGLVLMFLFLIFAAFWADYVYYKVNFREINPTSAKLSGKILTAEDIDEVVTLLDKRNGLLQDVLKGGVNKNK